MSKKRDTELGVDKPIARRDFLQGAAISTAALASGLSPELAQAAQAEKLAQNEPDYYPPAKTGMRGSHPGSFEAAHELRDGEFWKGAHSLETADEEYDLIIVGGGISGLSTAHFWRQARPKAKILIIDNHDDFGGHAKRNEFHVDGHTLILNGGTMGIESPYPYSSVADGLMKTLGIHPEELEKECADSSVYNGLKLQSAMFFDKETFGAERLVVGGARGRRGMEPDPAALAAFLAKTPLSETVQRDIIRIETSHEDYLAGLTADKKKDDLAKYSYKDYLLNKAKVDPGVITYYLHRTDGLWGCGIDAVSAIDSWGSGLPGFQGLNLPRGSTKKMGYTPAGAVDSEGSYHFHYPDGNASIARLLVRDLIPSAMPGHDARDIVTSKCDYGQLDRPGNLIRIRLNHMVVRVRNDGAAAASKGVEVAYTPSSGGGKIYRAKGKNCVLASWNMMIPYLCPELPAEQKAALHKLVKTPLVYTSVALRNWAAFQKLGIRNVSCPGSFHTSLSLNETINIGGFSSPKSPNEPILVHMTKTPAKANSGLNEREQHKAGRMELLSTSFETFERNIRDQMGRVLGAGGFDPGRDIVGIAVNRWPHGYSPEFNSLCDADTTNDRTPNLIGRKRFGRIAIANADAGMAAYTDVAMDQGYRAAHELLDT